jgi:Uma2 family endonuclease
VDARGSAAIFYVKLRFMEKDMRAVRPHLWTREEYDRMIEAGVFAPDERLELVEGEILQMVPQGSFHATAVRLVEDALRRAFGAGFEVRTQLPLALDPYSEPEPDIAVVPGYARDYRDAHPSTALLIVEVSDSTLDFDLRRKSSLYARAGIPDFWIVNLIDRAIDLFRDSDGNSYRSHSQAGIEESIAALSAPNCKIPVSDLLP